MKKMRLFGLLMAMIMGVSFTSCEEDGEAIISIVVAGEVDEEPLLGDPINISYNVVSDNKLDLVEHIINNVTVASVEDFNNPNSYAGTFSVPTNTVGQVIASIRVTDRKGLVEMETYTIDVQSNIETYTAVLLGNQSSENGSFYSTSTNEVFQLAQSAANAAKIDFIYLLDGESNVIAAPSDAFVPTKYSGVADWSVRNETDLKITVISSSEFDAIVDDSDIIAETNVALSKVSGLFADDVVAFTTAEGKKGLFKIVSIVDNTMKIEVKVQK
jgi:hypothetical protein